MFYILLSRICVLSVCIGLVICGVFSSISGQSASNDCVAQMKAAVNEVNANPKDSGAYYRRGLAYKCYGFQDVKDAVVKSRDSQNANSAGKSGASSVAILKNIVIEGGAAEKSIVDFSTAIKLNPKYKEAFMERALAFLTQGIGIDMESPKFDAINNKALADLNKVILLDPKNASAYKERALIRMHFEKHDLAIADYTKAIMLSPGSYTLYEARARAYYWKGLETLAKKDFQLSINDLTKAIGLATDPSVLSSLYDDRADSFALLEDKVNETADRKKAEQLKVKQ